MMETLDRVMTYVGYTVVGMFIGHGLYLFVRWLRRR